MNHSDYAGVNYFGIKIARGRGYVPRDEEPNDDGSYDWASGSGAKVFESFEEAGRFVDAQKGDGKWVIERA